MNHDDLIGKRIEIVLEYDLLDDRLRDVLAYIFRAPEISFLTNALLWS
jgi:hypothetical protein